MRPILLALLVLFLAACASEEEQAAPPPATPVRTYTVRSQDIPNVIELPGRVEPVRVAEVRARVTGIIQRRLYEEGTDVRAGQPLFQIDPAELRAAQAQIQAGLRRSRATAKNARAVVNRYRPLVAENAISRQEYDAAVASAEEAEANVAEIQAQQRAADLQLGYTTVRAPIAGRASRAEVTEGAFVTQAEGTLLTRVEQRSPIYVSFAQSATDLQQIRQAIASGQLELGAGERVEVRLTFPDGTEYPVPGYIDLVDFSVDESTGTVTVRAEFANPDGLLLPGEFVRAKIFAGQRAGGVAVPQRAVQLAQEGGTVFVIDRQGNAQPRPVELGPLVNGQWVITSGLRPGDVVIVSNLQKLRPGAPVRIANTPTGRRAAQPGQAPAPAPARGQSGTAPASPAVPRAKGN